MENMYSRFKMMEKWDQRLKFFRYERGYGGHVSDTDRLTLKLSFYGQDDLLMIFDDLEIVYERYESQPPQPESGKPYTSAEISNFPFLVPETQWIRQPAQQVIDTARVDVWCTQDTVEFTIRGSEENKYELAESDLENAEKLEKRFLHYGERIQP